MRPLSGPPDSYSRVSLLKPGMAIGRRSGKMSAIETISEQAIASERAVGRGRRVMR